MTRNFADELRTHSVFWSKLGFCYDPPRLGKDGKPIVFFDNWDQVKKYHRDFYQAGIQIHTCILFSGWTGVNRYDYELTDRVLEAIFSCGGKDLLYIPRIKLNVPMEWAKANPAELCVYADGPEDEEAIRALVGTEKHDLLGYQSKNGYYTAGGWQDDRPNLGGVISNQSFSSQKWLADAGEALRRLLRHLEDGPYGDRIPAYHIAYGVSGESCVWGRCNVHNDADYGITNRKMFFDWGLKKYRSLEQLRNAWCAPDLTRETARVPAHDHREGLIRNMSEFMRLAPEDRICRDYECFMTDANLDAMEHFGKIVKEETCGKPVGAFYGYFLEVARSAYTGYLGIQRFMHSPYLDFIAAPKREGGGEMSAAQSINRGKLWMDELDNRTCLAGRTGGSLSRSSDIEETKAVMWREMAKNLSHQSSFWWMDLGGGWYDSPELMQEIAVIEKTAAALRALPGESISEILVVVDEDSLHYHKTSFYLHGLVFRGLLDALNRTGAPYDLYRLQDLETLNTDRYRLIVFANLFHVDSLQWQRIFPRLPARAALLWYYAPGMLADDTGNLENITRLTGFSVREITVNDYRPQTPAGLLQGTAPLPWPSRIPDNICPVADNCPLLELTGPSDAEPCLLDAEGRMTGARLKYRGHWNFYFSAPLLQAAQLRKIMEFCGCTLYAPEGVLVYGDSRFLAFYAWQDAQINPPEKYHIPGEQFSESFTLPAKRCRLLFKKEISHV